ncbi:hypothetical protein AVEN_231137-1 [Araneus ventricosus]|uniref:Uncharacterized protein n=1 Tax=Araneus ventricosus TaxID=182803 RepID=A0A4Y2KYA6_ARAVE|nr:hypothetical protein AVEN_231137-1 [Araneus ventricosus]
MRALEKTAKKFSFHFGVPSPVFRTGARLKPLDPGGVSKSVPRISGHKIWWVIHRSDSADSTHGQPLVRSDHSPHSLLEGSGPVYCAPSSPHFQNEPSLP